MIFKVIQPVLFKPGNNLDFVSGKTLIKTRLFPCVSLFLQP